MCYCSLLLMIWGEGTIVRCGVVDNFRTFDRDYSLDLIRLVTHFVNLYSGLIVPPTLNSIITAWFRI